MSKQPKIGNYAAFATHVQNETNDKTRLILKSAILKNIDALVVDFRRLADMLGPVADTTQDKFKDYLSKNPSRPFVSIYKQFSDGLLNAPRQEELRRPFSSIQKTYRALEQILLKLAEEVTDNMPNSTPVRELTYEQMMLFGIIDHCDLFRFSSVALVIGLMCEQGNAKVEPLIERRAYQHLDHMTKVVNDVYTSALGKGKSYYDILRNNMRKKGFAINVWNDEGEPTLSYISPDLIDARTAEHITQGFIGLIRYIGQTSAVRFVNKRDQYDYEYNWLQSQLALITLKLNDMDPDSPEYIRTEKMVKQYQTMAMKTAAKLKQYDEAARG
jgi:hypothetical protein